VENLILVAMQDAVLVVSKDHAEQVKRVVDYLKENGGDLVLQHNRVYRSPGAGTRASTEASATRSNASW
jgi:hypothetical protein